MNDFYEHIFNLQRHTGKYCVVVVVDGELGGKASGEVTIRVDTLVRTRLLCHILKFGFFEESIMLGLSSGASILFVIMQYDCRYLIRNK